MTTEARAPVLSIAGDPCLPTLRRNPPTSRRTPATSVGCARSATCSVETDEKLRLGETAGARVWPTGFDALDTALTGGFRSGELVLLGGPQGLGKTAMALQMLRNAVAANRSAVLFTYEHDAHSILERLIAIEAGAIKGIEGVGLAKIRAGFEARHSRARSMRERFADTVGGAEAVEALESYAQRLHVHTSSGMHTTLDEIRAAVSRGDRGRRPPAAGARGLPPEGAGAGCDQRGGPHLDRRRATQGHVARARRAGGRHRGRRQVQPGRGPAHARATTCADPRPWPTRRTSC